MSTILRKVDKTFPVGTAVSVYDNPERTFSGEPPSTALEGATVAADGTLTYNTLADNTRYVAWTLVGGVDRYLFFRTDPPLALIPGDGVVRLSGDATITALDLVDVGGLSFPMGAGKDYSFEMEVLVQSTKPTCGVHLAVNGPANPQVVSYRVEVPDSPDGFSSVNAHAYDVPATPGVTPDYIEGS